MNGERRETQKIAISEEFKPGFTWRSALALVFASLTILPVNLYLQLVSGATIAGAATYITLIVFTELASLMGSPLTTQEVFIIFMMASVVAGSPVYINFVYRSYFVTSPITWTFKDPFSGKPLPEVIPSFWAPPYYSMAHKVRSFLHPEWIFPQLLSHFQFGILFIIQEIALTMLCSALYLDIEELPFPLADVNYQLIETLSTRSEEKMNVFLGSAFIGAFYSFIVYGIPTLMLGLFNVQLQIIPVPWADLTTGYLGVEKIMPGACFGISTDPLAFATGFILPLRVLIYMFIGSVATWTFGNWLALTVFRSYFPQWASEWKRGMSLSLIWQRSLLRVWIGPQIGIIVGLSILTFLWSFRAILRSLKSLMRARGLREKGYLPLPVLLLMYLGATGLSVLLFHFFVPDFPILFAALVSMGFSFLLATVSTRIRGETTIYAYPPYIWWGIVYLSGYPKTDAFFFQPVIGGSSVPLWTEALKTARLTRTRMFDFFKAFIFAFVLYLAFSFIFVSFFWLMAPIPSYVYPWTTIQWPIQAITECMWYSRQITTRVDLIGYSIAFVLILGVIQKVLARLTGFSLDVVSLLTGTTVIPPGVVTMLIGGLVGRFLLQRIFGRERWREINSLVVAGIATGEGIIVGIAAASILMFKTAWIKPY
ncbi:MAG: hypothetical protein DRO13_06110 [Thermoprotei archaeon]|nr:MAG: hypothetical protein DRO13_06110 [Thermoprotei archaeon]